jgi:biopolymer transport protein ExbB
MLVKLTHFIQTISKRQNATWQMLALILCTFSSGLAASDWQLANERIGEDLESAMRSLEATRRIITEEKIPLLQSVRTSEREVAELRRELQRQRRLRDNLDLDFSQLRNSVTAWREQIDYAKGLMEAYSGNFAARVSMAELQHYGEVLNRARNSDETVDDTDALQAQLALLGTAIQRLESLQGGKTFSGRALSRDGALEHGRFAIIGPWTFFVSDNSVLTGIAFTRVNAAEVTVADTGVAFAEGLRDLMLLGKGSLPADGSLGRALQIEMTRDDWRAHIAKGGYVGWVIIGLGLLALALALFKLLDLARVHAPSSECVEGILRALAQGDRDKACVAAQAERLGGRELLLGVIDAHGESRLVREEIFYERLLAIRPVLERFLPFIAITAAAAPLLGLLGTVTGMIKTFNLITLFGTGDAKSLSSGISEALITTELGLCVAIPALIVHGLLVRKVKHKLGQLEQTAIGILNITDDKSKQ